MSLFYIDNNGNKNFSEIAYKKILETSPNAIIITDLDGKIVFTSKRAINFFRQKESSSLIGEDVISLLPDEEKEHGKDIIKKAIFNEIFEDELLTFYDEKNNKIYVNVNASIIKNEKNTPEAIIFTARNITEKIIEEKELYFIKHVVDHSISLIIWFDEKANIKFVNKTALKLLGYKEEELLQKKYYNLEPSQKGIDWNKFIFDLKLKKYLTYESIIYTKENFSFPVEATIYYFNFKGEEVFCAFLRNISERRKAEHDLKESELFYRSIIDQSFAGVFLVNADTLKITYTNQAFSDILGYTKDELKQKTLCDLFSINKINDDENCDSYKAKLNIPKGEFTCQKKDGTPVYLYLNSSNITYNGENLISVIATDITKLKLTENALKESEEKFKLFADFTYDWEYWVSPENNIIYITPSCQQITGYSTQEFMNDPLLLEKIVHPKSKSLFQKHIYDERNTGKSFNISFKIITKFGEVRWINHLCQPVFNKDGKYCGRRVSNRDFTERKLAEDLLAESESRYRAVVENQSDIICQHDENGIIYFVNNAFCKFFQKKYDELIGSNSLNFLQPNIREEAKELFNKIKEDKSIEHFESQIFLESGETKWIHWTIQPIFDSNNKFIEFLSVGRDITERKFAEEALEEEKQRLKVTLKSIGDAVITLDTEGKIQLLSRAAEELFEMTTNELRNQYFSKIFNAYYYNEDKPFIENFYFEVIDGGITYESKKPLLYTTKSGNKVILNFSASPIRDKYFNIYGIVIVLKNITEAVKNAETIINSQKLESIGHLAAGIAHEFNNILTAILGNISLSKAILKNDFPKVTKRLEEAEKASLRAKDVAQQLITFAKGGEPIKTEFNIENVIKDISSYIFSNTNIKVDYNFIIKDMVIKADINQIRQMLSNVLLNSLESMSEGGNIYISLNYSNDEDTKNENNENNTHILIEIKDTGCGIPSNIMSKIFNPYFTTKPKGRGLGLTTAYYIAQRHNGTLSISSTPGLGTTVFIKLPVE